MFTAKENDMRESSIESKFRDEVKEVGGMAYKFVSPGNAGVPDRVVILQGGKSGFVSRIETSGRKNDTASESPDP